MIIDGGTQRVALVTGASRGIGRSVAEALAQGGYAVAVNFATRHQEADAVVAAIRAGGGTALAIAADGIRVNCVCPGFVETDMWTSVAREQGALMKMTPEEFTRQRAAQVPLGRMERPEDVAQVIAFLASDRAGYMTGQALSVDGGLVMH